LRQWQREDDNEGPKGASIRFPVVARRLVHTVIRPRRIDLLVRWLKELLDFWNKADHRRRTNVVEAALRRAGDRGRTKEDLVADTGLSQKKVKTALRKLRQKRRAEQDGARWRMRDGV